MTDREYERDRKRLEQQRAVAVLGMKAALTLVQFKENNADRARKAINDIIDKMQHEKTYKGKANKESLLKKKLRDQPKPYVSFSDSDRVVEETAKRFRIDWEVLSSKSYGQQEDVLDKISSRIRSEGPAEALLSFASDYTTAVYSLESLDKRRAEEAKEEAEAKRKEERKRQEEERRRQYEARTSSSSYDDDTPSYSTRRSTSSSYPRTETTPSETRPKPGINDPVSVEYIQREIDEGIQRGNEYLDYTLRRQIEKKYQELDQTDYYGRFYGSDNIEAIYKFYVLSEKRESYSPTLNYNRIVEMGILAVDIVFKDLMNGRFQSTTKMAEFMSQFKPHETLERYEKAYNEYIKYYNRLNAKEKEKVDNFAAKFEDYRKKFGISGTSGKDIATVGDIKKVVNRQVRKAYIDEREYDNYINEHNEVRFDNIDSFYYSLKYMDVEEIADLYATINLERERQLIYSRSDVV